MKASFLCLTALVALACAIPVDESSEHALRALDSLMKRGCSASGCPCDTPLDDFCTDSCFCQTACCNSQTALCQDLNDVVSGGGFCVGGYSN
jgi:hypothetical protein